MFRESSAHLQEDIVVYKQHMVPSLSIRVLVACRYAASCVLTGNQDSYREWWYHMLHVYNYVLLKLSTWFSKHVEENSILWINNNQCIKLVINVCQFMMHGQKNIKFRVRLQPSGHWVISDVGHHVVVRRLLDYVRSECSHSGVVEELSFPEYDALLIGKYLPAFQMSLLPPLSGSLQPSMPRNK